ncbi:4605_t:CDS:2 [Diversispora eburnea]|uniref:4605_t:CDS:1 n=1 Tax=Diversispora eburnea TaxID=1213867 RepID=A0A9N9D6Q2_9GLOM|nr:4605_t:CDS:2 [Diversispora eburnea]
MSTTNPLAESVKKWKRADVLKYLKSKQEEMDLDDEDISIIEKNKVAGRVFISLTEDKLIASPYNLLGGPAGAIALLIKELNSGLQASTSLQQPEKLENNLQTAEAIEKTHELPDNPISTSEESPANAHLSETEESPANAHLSETEESPANAHLSETEESPANTHLPETASGLLRYYELWNCHYTKWPSLNEFSDYLRDVPKDRVHHSFKMEVGVLRKLFANEHPAQLRLIQLESQLKMRQSARIIKKATRNATKLLAKKTSVKKELEIVEDSTIIGGYRRINKHYDSFHEASTQLVKRRLLADNDHSDSNHEVDGSKRCRQQ